jgi:predicted secreted protein
MNHSLWAALERPMLLWFAIPLIIVFSLVYGATRDERLSAIVQHALRAAFWTTVFMLVVFGILYGVSWLL